ncbi:ribonuclease H-like domain-containing protein [Tanacetum coccineum]
MGNSKKRVTKGKDGVYRVLPPTTQEEQFADEKERKARTLLLMAVPKDHLRRFHGMDDAKEIWAAIKTRFGGNANSKKMQKAVLKQQFEAFTISSKESLEKGYDRFQKLLSQLDALGAGVSDEDANHKFLRSLPPAWDNIQKTSSSSLASDNVAFLSQAKASSSKHKPSHSSGSYSSYTTSSSKATPTATPGLADEVIPFFSTKNAYEECKFKGSKEGSRQEAGKGQNFKPMQIEKEALMTIDEGYNDIPLYSRFKQVEYKGVPHPLSGDYTPREQEDIDDSLDGELGAVSDASSTHYSTCQSNDSDGELRTVSDHSVNDDPIHDHIPIPSIEKVTIATQKTQPHMPKPTQTVDPSSKRLYETTDVRQATPAWTNANRVNKANQVNVNTGHGNVSSGNMHVNSGTQIKSGASRYNTGKQHVNSGSVHVNSSTQIKSGTSRFNTGKQHVSSGIVNRPVSNKTNPKPSQVNLNSPKKYFSKQRSLVNRPFSRNTAHKSNIYAVKGKMGTAVKTSVGCVWRKITPLSNTNSGPTPNSNVNVSRGPQGRPKPMKTWTCNRVHLEDYQELSKVGSVLFGEVKICDKKLNVLFTEKECFVVSSDFKMPDANQIENQLNQKVKIIRSDNGTEFKNRVMLEFCGEKGIKQEFSNARTPQQNGVAERMNRTLIEAARTMLADSHLPTTFWAEAVNTACYTFNRKLMGIDEDADLWWYSSTSPSEATRNGSLYEKIAKKKTHSPKKPLLHNIQFDDDIMTLEKSWKFTLHNEAISPSDDNKKVLNGIQEPRRIERGVVCHKQTRLVAQVKTRRKNDYDEVFAPVARIEAIRLFLAFASFIGFIVYQMDVKSAFLYGTIDEEVYVSQPPGFVDPDQSYKVYKSIRTRRHLHISRQEVAEILKKIDLVKCQSCHHSMETKFAFEKGLGNSKDFSSQCCQEDLQVSQGQTKLGIMTIVATSTTEAEYVAAAMLWTSGLYALTSNPTIYDSLVKQFWQTATTNTIADGTLEINATIDTIRYTITEASIRDTLQLEDATGITMLPNDEIFEGMGQMGYPTDGTFTFWKSFFTPQWRYLVHHLLHCISSKSGGWDQFGSNIATALICLSTNRVYNFSKLIFDGMVANLKSKTKFLMYPRFLQMILNIQTENKHLYLAVSLTKKIFGNMKRGFRGAPRPLLPAMLLVATNPNAGQEHDVVAPSQPSSSTPPVPSTSSPPVITTPTPIPATIPSPTPIPETEPEPFEHIFEEPSPVHQPSSPPQEQAQGQMAMDDLLQVVPKLISRIDSLETDLKQTKLTMGNAIVKLVKKVKKLEGLLKKRHVVLSDSEEEEPEAQGRKSQDDPLASSVQGLVTPSTTKVKASGEEQVEDIRKEIQDLQLREQVKKLENKLRKKSNKKRKTEDAEGQDQEVPSQTDQGTIHLYS